MKSVNETRICHKCGQVGHIARYCRNKATAQDSERMKSSRESVKSKWAFVANASDDLDEDDWSFDTGASCHLVRDVCMLFKAGDCATGDVLRQPDGTSL